MRKVLYLILLVPYFSFAEQQTVQLDSVTVIGGSESQSSSLGSIPLHELPLNSYVINRSEITRLQFIDPDDVLDRIPGETQVRNLRIPNGGKGYTIPMVDGMPLVSPYGGATQHIDQVNTQDIDSIQVIKGSSSALYGNNAFGGVINVITRDPSEELEGRVWAETGNFSRQRYGVNVSDSIGDLGFFIDANSQRLEGMRDGEQDDRDQFSAKVVYDLTNTTRFISRLEHFSHDHETRGDLTREEIKQDQTQAGSLSSATELDQQSASFKLEHRNNQHLFDAVAIIRQKDSTGISRFRGPQESDDKNYQARVLYNYVFSHSDLTIGTDLYRGTTDTKQYDRQDTDLSGEYAKSDNKFLINAYFAQYRNQISKQLMLTLGARYEDIEAKSSIYQDSAKFDDFSPKLGANFQLNKDHMLWANVSQGFYAPDTDDLFDADNGNSDLKAEKSQSIEFGVRGIVDGFIYDSAFYQNIITDYLVTQEFGSEGNEYEKTTNAGKVTVQGLETVLEYIPQHINWRFALTHTLADNKYNQFDNSDGDYSGNLMSRSPLHHLNLRVAWLPVTGFSAELEGDFYSDYYSDDANSSEGSFTRDERVNLRLSYDYQKWRFWLNAMNLTDTVEDRASFRRGKLKFRTAAGRNYYAGVAYHF